MQIVKIDQNSNIVIGAEFELKSLESGHKYFGKTDDDGKISFDDLKSGKYVLKETMAPKGYMKKNDGVIIEIPFNKIVKIKFPNKKL